MCQLAYVSNLKKLNKKQKHQVFDSIQKIMTSANKSGYGVAIKDHSGLITTKKTLDVSDMIGHSDMAPVFCKKRIEGSLKLDKALEVIFHARTSTNSVSLENTHPYVIGNTTLCHNGVVDYAGENYDKKTDNDTEDLTYYFDKYHMTNLDSVFSGYAAFIAFKNESTYIVRDSQASLTYAYSKSLDCHFFATNAQTIRTIGDILKVKLKVYDVEDNQHIEIRNNKIIGASAWGGLSWSRHAASKSGLSLGRSIEYSDYYYNSELNNNDVKSEYMPAALKSSVNTLKTNVAKTFSGNTVPNLEYIGKFEDTAKYFFNSTSEVYRCIEMNEVIAKHDGRILTASELENLENKSDVSLFWAC